MENEKKILWQPQPKQRIALECPIYELFYGGARGGGKSDFLVLDFLQDVGKGYGDDWKGVLFRRTYSELEELIFRAHQIFPEAGGTYHESKRTWTFPDGETLKFRFLERDSDVHKYQGHQYSWIGFDELTNWATDYCYIYMHSCARSAAGVPVRIRASGNPGSTGHLWVKARFIDPMPPYHVYTDPETGLKRVFIPARLEDNLILKKNDPQYLGRLKMQPKHLQRAYIEGDWNIFAGQVFEEIRREKHFIKPVAIEPYWYRFAALDWGYTKPFSIGWYAVTGDGRLIRYREYYGCEKYKPNVGIKKPAAEVAKEAWEMSVAEGCIDMVADPSCWAKMGKAKRDEPQSIAEEFEKVGWRMERGVNDRKSGLQLMHNLLQAEGHDGLPMLIVFETCYAWIRTIPTLVHSERDPEDVDTDGEDHVYDETRYAVMSSFARQRQKSKRRISDYKKPQRTDWDPLTWK
jgi:hypothetical protein